MFLSVRIFGPGQRVVRGRHALMSAVRSVKHTLSLKHSHNCTQETDGGDGELNMQGDIWTEQYSICHRRNAFICPLPNTRI